MKRMEINQAKERPRWRLVCGLFLVTTWGAVAAQDNPRTQDEIILTNGSRIVGVVSSSRDGVVIVDTDFAGSLSIKTEHIQSLHTVGPRVMVMSDGRTIRDQPIALRDDSMTLLGEGGDELDYELADILLVNPEPWEMGEGYKWSGSVSLAWALERGNSDTDELDYKLETIWRSDDDRYTLRINGEQDEANDQKNADNWTVLGKYDRFLAGAWYWGVNMSAEQDRFADLDLRAYVGPYVGREIYTDPLFALDVELGLSYVSEEFISAEDQNYPGAGWSLHIASNYLGGDSRLYIDHLGIWNLQQTSDVILNTTFGLEFPLVGNLRGAAEILLEYDSGAVGDVEDLDQTYNFRVGYSW